MIDSFRRFALASFLFAVAAVVFPASDVFPQAPVPASRAAAKDYGKLPLSFEANQGQSDAQVRFLARGGGYSVYLTDSGAVLALSKAEKGSNAAAQADVVRMELTGANRQAKATGTDPLPGIANYFLGNDPAKWHSNIPTYARVRYAGVYDGVDLVYYGNQGRLEYDFVVAPEADPKPIRLCFAGARKLSLTAEGDLKIQGKDGEIAFHKPEIYQETDGKRTEVAGKFTLLAGNTVGFSVGAYDRARPLTIDPVLSYSTFLSGGDGQPTMPSAIATDTSGNAYITGTTSSVQFPVTAGAYDTSFTIPLSTSMFISKLNSEGTAPVYSTYLGIDRTKSQPHYGYNAGHPTAIAVDPFGQAYITGVTGSPDFPTTAGAIQTTISNIEGVAFVTALNASGSGLVYSTLLGGSGSADHVADQGNGIAVDSSGNAYIVGTTGSGDFPVTPGAYQTVNNTLNSSNTSHIAYPNAFVTKLNPTGTGLIYSTYLGGNRVDYGVAIAIDDVGSAYVTGRTLSVNFPISEGAFQTKIKSDLQSGTSFITKFNPQGSALAYSTLLGGSNNHSGDFTSAIAVDGNGYAYVTGTATSTDFPVTSGAFQTVDNEISYHGQTGFVTKLNLNGTGLVYSTYLGGSNANQPTAGYADNCGGIGVDSQGNVYVDGKTTSATFPTTASAMNRGSVSGINAEAEGFLSEIDPSGSTLLYSTYLGSIIAGDTSGIQYQLALAVNPSGNVFTTGLPANPAFVISAGAFQTEISPSIYGSTGYTISPFVLMVNPSELTAGAGTTTVLTASNPTPDDGVPVTFTAQVSAVNSTAKPTGNVDFWVDGTPSYGPVVKLATVLLDAQGKATWTGPANWGPKAFIVSNYTASADFALSSSTVYQAVSPVSLEVVSGNKQTTVYGKSFQPLTVQAIDADGKPVPSTGLQVFSSGTGLNFSPTTILTDSNGRAQITVTPVESGNLTATISGGGGTPATFTLSATKALLYISAKNQVVTYGQTPLQPTAYILTGFVDGDTSSVVSGAPVLTTSVTATTPVGVYKIGVQVGTLTAANYTFSTVSNGEGAVTVVRAPLYVAAKGETITYGQTPAQPTAYTLTGFVNGENSSVVSGAPVLSTTVTSAAQVGFYPIGVKLGTLSAANYSFSTVSSGAGGITVGKAPLVIHPNNFTIHAGDPLPAFTYTLSGFVNGDTQASATSGAPAITTTAANTSTPGHYYIVANVGSLAAKNYSFNQPTTATDGILTILP